jgi:hypothetical protein
LESLVRELFRLNGPVSIKYQDDEQELISISSTIELEEAFAVSKGLAQTVLKLHVFATGLSLAAAANAAAPLSSPTLSRDSSYDTLDSLRDYQDTSTAATAQLLAVTSPASAQSPVAAASVAAESVAAVPVLAVPPPLTVSAKVEVDASTLPVKEERPTTSASLPDACTSTEANRPLPPMLEVRPFVDGVGG